MVCSTQRGLRELLKTLKKDPDEVHYRTLILGLDNAGKTTLLKTLAGEDTSHISATQGFNIKDIHYLTADFHFWDIGGGLEGIRPYWVNYFDYTHRLVYVVDSSDRGRMNENVEVLRTVLGNEKLRGVPLFVVANAKENPEALSAGEVFLTQVTEALQLNTISDRRWTIMECSCKDRARLEEILAWLYEKHDQLVTS